VFFECPLDHSGLSQMWCTLAVSASTSVRNLAKNFVGGSVVVASVAIYMFNNEEILKILLRDLMDRGWM